MKKIMLCLLVSFCFVVEAHADTFHFTGYITYHNDVIYFNFSLLNDATDVKIWTDSFQSGLNFDPMIGVWTKTGSFIVHNDDNSSVGPNQTYWDSGIVLASLLAGNYIVTLASYDNFPKGSALSDGFKYDGEPSIPIQQWWIGGEGYYSLWFEGVDTASASAVPIPGAIFLLGSGLLSLVCLRRFRKG